MEGYRRLLFPDIREAYQRRPGDVNWREIDDVRRKAFNRFHGLRQTVLALYNSGGPEAFSRGLQEMMQKVA
jgi:CRISPR/Cas system CSM-associated protein Csm2 small subunit